MLISFDVVKKYFIALMLFVFLVACGGGSDSGSNPSNNNDNNDGGPPTKQGTLTGIEGLSYSSGSLSGLTDSNGAFDYEENGTVTFSIGDIVIATINGTDTLALDDLSDNDDTLTNIRRFLQTLDDDANSNNGILIIEAVRNLAVNMSVNFDQTTAAFEDDGNVQTVVSELTTVTSAGARILIDTASSSGESTLALSGDDTAAFGSELVLDGFAFRPGEAGARNYLAATKNARFIEGEFVADAVFNIFDFSDISAGISMRINHNGASYLYSVTALNCEAVDSELSCDSIVFDTEARTVTITDATVEPALTHDETAPLTINGVLQWSEDDE